ncbi:MAG: tetratricopeptide repeat protein [Pseudomonadota bacterium]
MRQLPNIALAGILLAALATASYAMTAEEAGMVATAAERGDDGSQVLLALMYQHGEGGYRKDAALAAHWFELAATQGNAYAQKMLGDIYAAGMGVPRNPRLAADWREKAAKRGNVDAQCLLGKMYLYGEGVDKDQGKAEQWLNRAADEGNSEAQYLLGKLHYNYSSSAEERAVAGNLLARSATQGYADAIHFLHFMEKLGYNAEEEYFHGSPHIRKLAEDGDPEAQYQLAIRYESGVGVKRDYPQALHWFTLAANSGHLMAMKSLADIYARGLDGVDADKARAAHWSDRVRQAETAVQQASPATAPE